MGEGGLFWNMLVVIETGNVCPMIVSALLRVGRSTCLSVCLSDCENFESEALPGVYSDPKNTLYEW